MALREGWNFHNDIALPLESIARRHFSYSDRPVDTIFDADSIEHTTFVEAMIVLLNSKFNNKTIDTKESFIIKCNKYLARSGNEIDHIVSDNLFREFEQIYKSE